MTHELQTEDAWNKIHQPFELAWWKRRLAHHCASPGFEAHWRPVKDWIKPSGYVIDIGCGPRPPFAPCAVIEPLANEYQKLVPPAWWKGVRVFNQPAEQMVDGLLGDTIICWNCIDHAVGWRRILDNMLAMRAPNGRFALATDFFPPFEGHPGFDRDEFMAEIDARFVITDRREPFGRHLALLMVAK